ncbi:metallophosphoesterase family protein [Cetobacterium sp.]|uniref:metallophosphoesterase family protein n=1 Tax=Cetobacterium sp. TaxID=2071632 RepID=UPI003F328788
MKITIASDIHLNLILAKKIVSTKSDMIIISGDLSNRGHMEEIELILNIINKSEAKYKIVVFGNHDVQAEFNLREIRKKFKDIIFLNNEIVEIEGLKIYGTPYVRDFCFWGFQYYTLDEREDLTVPKEEVDIIIAHEPPSHEKLSYLPYDKEDIGNMSLRKYIENTDRVKYVICGHVHENSRNEAEINKAKCYNVSMVCKEIEINWGK